MLFLISIFGPQYLRLQKIFQKTGFCSAGIKKFILFFSSCSCNGYEISELVSEKGSLQNLELGGAIFPTVSLSNHSCVPNTMRHNDGIFCVIRASVTISKGEEVTDNYGHFFQVDSFK